MFVFVVRYLWQWLPVNDRLWYDWTAMRFFRNTFFYKAANRTLLKIQFNLIFLRFYIILQFGILSFQLSIFLTTFFQRRSWCRLTTPNKMWRWGGHTMSRPIFRVINHIVIFLCIFHTFSRFVEFFQIVFALFSDFVLQLLWSNHILNINSDILTRCTKNWKSPKSVSTILFT